LPEGGLDVGSCHAHVALQHRQDLLAPGFPERLERHLVLLADVGRHRVDAVVLLAVENALQAHGPRYGPADVGSKRARPNGAAARGAASTRTDTPDGSTLPTRGTRSAPG